MIIREFKLTTTATATGTSLNKGLMSRTMAVHVRYNSFLCRHLQNNMANSALSEERELRRINF